MKRKNFSFKTQTRVYTCPEIKASLAIKHHNKNTRVHVDKERKSAVFFSNLNLPIGSPLTAPNGGEENPVEENWMIIRAIGLMAFYRPMPRRKAFTSHISRTGQLPDVRCRDSTSHFLSKLTHIKGQPENWLGNPCFVPGNGTFFALFLDIRRIPYGSA